MKIIFALFVLLTNACLAQVNLQAGLRAYYPFSGNAKDESGNNNHPVFNNARLTADRFGKPKSAYHFNGQNAYIKILNSPSLNSKQNLSICVWVKPQGFYSGQCHGNSILMKGDADYLTGNYFFRFEDGVYLKGTHCDSYTAVDASHQNFNALGVYSSMPYIKANRWYSLIVTYDGKTAKLYIDCRLVASRPQKGATFSNIYDLYLGKSNSIAFPYWFKGDMDEVRIYDRALNLQEIMAVCDEIPEVKKPEYVKEKIKEKKNNDLVKPKKADPKTGASVNEMNPLVANKDLVEFKAGTFNQPTVEPEKEIVLENRKNDLVKEIIVENDSISVTLYDNAEIDGDSITLIYNDKILTTHQRLTDKPLTFVIPITRGANSRNELVMYAENVGSIPPNTALMVIYDGKKRIELNIKSTEKTNGAVSFKLRE
ncbi:MAG: LamG domain-containing protein [Ferruginibacter sp.]